YQIELMDGSEFIGTIVSLDSALLQIKTSSIPKIQIYVETIKKMKVIENKMEFNGTTALPNPHPTRYFFAPSAYNLAKGEKYYQNSDLLLHSVNVGVTDHFSIGAGLELISTFATIGKDWSPIFFFTPKVGYQVAENLNVGAGMLFVYMGPLASLGANTSSFNMEYGLVTYGTKENNVTLGMSTTLHGGKFMFDGAPITINGMFRMGGKTTFITENWILPNAGAIYSYGVRFFGSKMSVDVGFLNNKDLVKAIFIGIPYLDFVVKF
ncbi:MAG: hypothetical protein NTY32_05985, partial [Bacteroidia bacterium]|nr:hypothetical protein [Bacteroidia bacterium]